MSSENTHSERWTSTDPLALRAVAHPVRLELLYALHRDGPLTAGRCAELLGLSPKVCSYHLNVLGKYGLIEETGEGKGRSRPWRVVTAGVGYVHEAGESPATANAEDQLARTLLARDVRVIEAFIAGRRTLPRRWRNVAAMTSTPLRLTAQQLAALRAELMAMLDRYAELGEAPTTGARAVHVAAYAVPADLPLPG